MRTFLCHLKYLEAIARGSTDRGDEDPMHGATEHGIGDDALLLALRKLPYPTVLNSL